MSDFFFFLRGMVGVFWCVRVCLCAYVYLNQVNGLLSKVSLQIVTHRY